jgi:hypothetical protein
MIKLDHLLDIDAEKQYAAMRLGAAPVPGAGRRPCTDLLYAIILQMDCIKLAAEWERDRAVFFVRVAAARVDDMSEGTETWFIALISAA